MSSEKSQPGPPPLAVAGEDAAASDRAGDAVEEVAAAGDMQRVWNSHDLLGTEPEALIVHRGQTYRLRCTKQGKLILYK